MNLKSISKVALAVVIGLNLAACGDGKDGQAGQVGAQGQAGVNGVSTFVTRDDVLKTNANIAYAAYSDSLFTAQALQLALKAFVAAPTVETMADAKHAWLASREPYGQTEVYRFRSGPIDELKADGTLGKDGSGPEGRLNAWPLGEALIDYVAPVVDGNEKQEDGTFAISGANGKNIIANSIDYPKIDAATIKGLFETGEDERNVTTGYHGIEFLLWGQDLNKDMSGEGNRDFSGGQRPVSDYQMGSLCTSGPDYSDEAICKRRGEYLLVAAQLLIDELKPVVKTWEPSTGTHYNNFVKGGDASLAKILEGMGRLSFGELAGERINIALITNSQEDEHSCFSDNTHRDIFLNAKGVQNSFRASYTRINGEEIKGASIFDLLVTKGEHELANKLRGSLEATMAAAAVIDTKAKSGMPFDMLIQEGPEQKNVLAVIKALVAQTDDIEQAIKALGVTTSDIRQDTEEKI
ncbi:MAG: metalloproteinase [Gammaproteobacteria bacterium]|nr:metalloproteinase [Gammaproteobacteria bacterium]